MTERCVEVVYRDKSDQPQLPNMADFEEFYQVEIDENIVLADSLADTGVRVNLPEGVLNCEIFGLYQGYRNHWLEIYPLDGANDPLIVEYDTGKLSIFDEAVLRGVVTEVFTRLGNPELVAV